MINSDLTFLPPVIQNESEKFVRAFHHSIRTHIRAFQTLSILTKTWLAVKSAGGIKNGLESFFIAPGECKFFLVVEEAG